MNFDFSNRSTEEKFVNEIVEKHGYVDLPSVLIAFARAVKEARLKAEGRELVDGRPDIEDLPEAFAHLWSWASQKSVRCYFE